MIETIGEFDQRMYRAPCPDLAINIDSEVLRQWQQGARLASYVASYMQGLLGQRIPQRELEELGAALNYAVSELFENAVKFSAADDVGLRALDATSELVLCVDNFVDSATASGFLARARQLADGDPLMMMMEQVEHGECTGSGLGLLSLMADYGARVGWQFTGSASAQGLCRVAVMVRFAVSSPAATASVLAHT